MIQVQHRSVKVVARSFGDQFNPPANEKVFSKRTGWIRTSRFVHSWRLLGASFKLSGIDEHKKGEKWCDIAFIGCVSTCLSVASSTEMRLARKWRHIMTRDLWEATAFNVDFINKVVVNDINILLVVLGEWGDFIILLLIFLNGNRVTLKLYYRQYMP